MTKPSLVLSMMVALAGVAVAEVPKVVPVPKTPPVMAPKFSCAVTPNAKGPSMVTITKVGGGPTAADKDVVATILLPKDKKDASVCGSALVKANSAAKVSFTATIEPKFPYTCTAAQGRTTFACNPVK
jgi:hypothetical protein